MELKSTARMHRPVTTCSAWQGTTRRILQNSWHRPCRRQPFCMPRFF